MANTQSLRAGVATHIPPLQRYTKAYFHRYIDQYAYPHGYINAHRSSYYPTLSRRHAYRYHSSVLADTQPIGANAPPHLAP